MVIVSTTDDDLTWLTVTATVQHKMFRLPIAIGTTAVSLYAAQKSYIAITNLQKYEERSERAAKHSETAAHELHKTRTTQGSSAGAVSISLMIYGTVISIPSISLREVSIRWVESWADLTASFPVDRTQPPFIHRHHFE